MLWDTSLPDWESRIVAGQSLVPDLPLFEEEAARALRVFKRLRIPDVIGTPTMSEACGEWFFPIVAAMFGSYDPEHHIRMIQEYFWLVPKKNSKSSNGGAIMLTATIVNRRPEAEFVLIAPTITIANIAFKQAMGTIRLDTELDKLFQCRSHLRSIQHRINGTTLQIKAADTDVITGGKQVGTMIDETHVFAKKSNAADIFVELRGALAARPDGFLFQTTTQSKEPPAGVFKQELDMARKVRDGQMKRSLLPILYEFPEKLAEADAWRQRKYWHIVNPNLNRSVNAEFLEGELTRAAEAGQEEEILIASQHFNVEIGVRLGSDAWPGARYWEGAALPGLTLEELIDRSDVIVAAGDGGGLDDLLGLSLIGRDKTTNEWLGVFRAWAQMDVLERRKQIAARLRDFEAEGTLTICGEDDPQRDIREFCDIIETVFKAGLLPEKAAIGLDAFGITAIIDELASRGIAGDMLCAVPQGYKLNGAVLGLERKLKDGTFWHDGSAMMNWVVGNAKIEQRGNAVLVTKQAAGKAKIDPLAAGFNAVQLMSRNPVSGQGPSVYEERGLLAI